MGQVIRVSLPGYDALTDTNPDHFALYSDEDWVLIKEYTRGSISADDGGGIVIHNLGYTPTVFVYYNDGSKWIECTGQFFSPTESFPAITIYPIIFVDDTSLIFFGDSATPTDFKYFICYDQQL